MVCPPPGTGSRRGNGETVASPCTCVQQNSSSKTTSGVSGWLSLVLGEHSHFHKDKEVLQVYMALREKSRAALDRRYSFTSLLAFLWIFTVRMLSSMK